VAAEVGVGVLVLVLVLTAVLVNSVPGREAYAPSYSATLAATDAQGRGATVLVDVDRTRSGLTTMHLYTYTTVGAVLPFTAAQGRLVERSKRLGPVSFGFDDSGPGHGTALNVVVPTPGEWTLTVRSGADRSQHRLRSHHLLHGALTMIITSTAVTRITRLVSC
jgi:copper transport protein